MSYTSEYGKNRVDLIRKCYPEVDSLKRISIPGPNGTIIYVMAESQDMPVFAYLGERVRINKEVIEKVSSRRKSAKSLLDKIKVRKSGQRVFCGETQEKIFRLKNLKKEEIEELRRLVRWEI